MPSEPPVTTVMNERKWDSGRKHGNEPRDNIGMVWRLTCPLAILPEVDPGDAPGSQEKSIEPTAQGPQLAQHHLKYVQCTNTSCSSPVCAKKNTYSYVPQTCKIYKVRSSHLSCICASVAHHMHMTGTGCLEGTWCEISCMQRVDYLK